VKAAEPNGRPPAPSSPKSPPSRFRAVLPLAVLAAGILLLAGVLAVGWLALQALRGQERYRIAFADIDCTPPPHLSREDFLEEVQFFAHLPDSVCVLDDGLPARLSAAFAKHPWVERVQSVEVLAPRRVRVRLLFRTAVLIVPPKRAVDANGVRLPEAAAEDDLPVLRGDAPPPTGQEGQPWGDDRVQAAARAAAFLRPYQDRLNLRIVAMGPDGLALYGASWSARWGAAPESEPLGEATAEAKRRRLLDFVAQHDDGASIDLRPSEPAP